MFRAFVSFAPRRSGAICLMNAVLLLALPGCQNSDSTAPTSPELSAPYWSQAQGGEEWVAWQDNVIEDVDEHGNLWRAERDQENATTVSVFKNGVLQGTMDLTWQGSDVTFLTFTDPATSGWAKSTVAEDPVIVETSAGGGGYCDPGDPFCEYPWSAPTEECPEQLMSAGHETTLMGDGCGTYYVAAGAAYGAAATYGVMTYAAVKTPGGQWFARDLFRKFTAAVAAAGAATGALIACEMAN